MEYVVYILYSEKHKRTYVGYTSHLIERIKSHNIYGKDSTRFFRPWIVVYVEFYCNKIEAGKREKYFKAGKGVYAKQKILEEFIRAHTLPQSEGRRFESFPRY